MYEVILFVWCVEEIIFSLVILKNILKWDIDCVICGFVLIVIINGIREGL